MSTANHAHRAIGVLLGGPFAPQRLIEPKPVVCALLRSRGRLLEAVQMHATTSASAVAPRAVGHHG